MWGFGGTTTLTVEPGALVMLAAADDDETLGRVKDVTGRHLERSARRTAWSLPGGSLAVPVRSGTDAILSGMANTVAEDERHRLTAVQGLAALSLDALSSVAYGPEAILVVLAAADDDETLDRVKDVTGRHLERFARRTGSPLPGRSPVSPGRSGMDDILWLWRRPSLRMRSIG